MNANVKQSITVAVVALTAGVIGSRLGAPTAHDASSSPPRAPHVHANRWSNPDTDIARLRLVSCGDSRSASAFGDDMTGHVRPGAGATSCTIVYAIPWAVAQSCMITSGLGRVSAQTPTDLIVSGVDGPFDYACVEAAR